MGKGGGSNNVTVEENLLPPYAQPNVEQYLTAMTELSNKGYATYPGATYADMNETELAGIEALSYRSRSGSDIVNKGKAVLGDILDGNGFNTNSRLSSVYSQKAEALIREFAEETLPQIHQRFNLSGNLGSDSHHYKQAKEAEKLMARLQDISTDLHWKDYIRERQHQINGIINARLYGDQEIRDADMLKRVGEMSREWKHGKNEDDYRRWHDEVRRIVKQLEYLGNGLRSIVGSRIQTVAPFYRPNTIGQIASLAMTGIGMYAMSTTMNDNSGELTAPNMTEGLEG